MNSISRSRRTFLLVSAIGLLLAGSLAPILDAVAQSSKRISVRKAETYIPDLMELEAIELRQDSTIAEFRFLRSFCGAALQLPGTPSAFRLTDARPKGTAFSMELRSATGVLTPGKQGVCGKAGDRFAVVFGPLPANITHVNITEGLGGKQGDWSWYNIKVR